MPHGRNGRISGIIGVNLQKNRKKFYFYVSMKIMKNVTGNL